MMSGSTDPLHFGDGVAKLEFHSRRKSTLREFVRTWSDAGDSRCLELLRFRKVIIVQDVGIDGGIDGSIEWKFSSLDGISE